MLLRQTHFGALQHTLGSDAASELEPRGARLAEPPGVLYNAPLRRDLHDRRRLRTPARRLDRRPPALVRHLLDQHPHGARGIGHRHVAIAPPTPPRAAASLGHFWRGADRDFQHRIHAGIEPGRRALCVDVAADPRAVCARADRGRAVRPALAHGAGAAHPDFHAPESDRALRDRGQRLRLGLDHRAQCLSTDVPARRDGSFTEPSRTELGGPDGCAQH